MADILVVDDDPGVRESIGGILRQEGHQPEECADGIQALRRVNDRPPDLVLLDLAMPGISGESVATMLKADEATRIIPIVVLSGEGGAATQCRLLEIGVEEFLSKPVSRMHLLARVRALLRAKALNDQALQAFRAVEAMEAMSVEMFHRAAVDPQRPADLLEVALGHCVAGALGPGAPTHLFAARDDGAELSGEALWHDPAGGILRRGVRVSRLLFLRSVASYKQVEGAYWALSPAPGALALLWPHPPVRGAMVGVMDRGLWLFAGGYDRPVGVHDCRWLSSVAKQAGLFGAHLEQVAATEEAFVYVMEALARAAEAHDGGTGAHLRRVNGYAGLLARALGCADSFVRKVSQSAMMHDVGKIQISREILLKPGNLSGAEVAQVRRHPEAGALILGSSARLTVAREIALCHHERWDGSGYPRGLRGEEIPLSARIVSLADVYDALRMERPYKRAVGHAETLRILGAGDAKTSPAHFDPACLRVFLRLDEALAEVFREGQGPEIPC